VKVLLIVTYLYDRGGDSNHAIALGSAVQARGFEVEFFGMESSRNFERFHGPYAPNIEFPHVASRPFHEQLGHIFRPLYSMGTRKSLRDFIRIYGPFDLAHIHSMHHQLTLSTIDELKRWDIPAIWTLHDYKIICPATSLYVGSSGSLCPHPGRPRYLCATRHRCKRSSIRASLMADFERMFIQLRRFYEYPSVYIAPSDFLARLVRQSGIPREITVLHNFSPFRTIAEDSLNNADANSAFLYVGRVESIKGVEVLLRSFARIASDTDRQLIIVGAGEELESYQNMATVLGIIDNVVFTGHVSDIERMRRLYSNSLAVVIPSLWYENYPLSALEAFSLGKPVIASNIGGLPEIVRPGKSGFLFEPGDVKGLARLMQQIDKDPEIAVTLGREALQQVREENSIDVYIDRLLPLYRRAAERGAASWKPM